MNCRLLILLLFPLFVSAQGHSNPDLNKQDEQFILKAFNNADNYMNSDHYDSAQLWLNKIYLKVSYRKPSLFSYFLTSRQAEVYYYNNLHELGLQEAFKGENIASVLKDSILMADACNFIGLFYMNNNKLKDAVKYFRKGLKFAHQPPYPAEYIELSKPHHINGNLAEAFEKLHQSDSAVYYSRESLTESKQINSKRGTATAFLNLGNAYFQKNNIDSAKKYFESTRIAALAGNDFDVELNSYSGLANCAAAYDQEKEALSKLEMGFMLLKKYPQLNDFYSLMFLETAIKLYKKYNDQIKLIKTLELKNRIQTSTYARNNTQIQTLLLTGLKNEKLIFNLELAESENKQSLANTRVYVLLLVLLSIIIAFIAYRYYALQRLRLANLRSKISQDLHDEVGATLSGIAMYSYITKEQIKNQEHDSVNNSLDIIKDNAGEMVAKLNDIVWAVHPHQDNLFSLLERLKDFAAQLTTVKNIQLVFDISESLAMLKLSMEQRKNIYLICKEGINNAVKYSNCKTIIVKVTHYQRLIQIIINDDGSGFLIDEVRKGNGLTNMASRAREINADLKMESIIGFGTKIRLSIK
ncbi:tetratricopeptide repeat-containing sensor histidine kinase [Pedobacter sp. Leaf250]|uniref:tetratricopeptide repeat-containing sensor histidine kinase n=1 Tax=Pedobacter sp. Leaf250 TaxID=2876559 RepID=UPI001E65B349|nr:tetratricopeptide repeat-containing sensor histidine kinase [Pedobacter sp. Leaf250]